MKTIDIVVAILVAGLVVIMSIKASQINGVDESLDNIDSLITAKVDSTINTKFGRIVSNVKDWSMLMSELVYHRSLLRENNPYWKVQRRLGTYQYYWKCRNFERWRLMNND